MKMTLEFTKFSERYPEDKNRDVLVIEHHKSGSEGSCVMRAGNHWEVPSENESRLWWSYFYFQPERLSEKTPDKGDAIV